MAALDDLEKKLHKTYQQASKEAQDKVNEFYAKFKQLDAIKRKQVKEGKLDEDVYLTWRKNKMLMGQKYQDLVNVLAKDMTNTNQIAASIINGYTPEAYANGMNYGTYQVEHDARMNTSFSLYNRQTVERMVREDPDVIPWIARIDIPKDLRWNKQHINNAITQGVLQGESIPKVAKRLQGVAQMNNTQATRTARTAMTAANNAGHQNAFERAQGMGIRLKKQWIAALDSRTRDSHAVLDGESVPLDKEFSNGLMYPGDPSGKPAEVYNCRCRQIADVEGVDQGKIDDMTLRNDRKLGDMSYSEWKSYHQERFDKKKSKQISQQTPTLKDIIEANKKEFTRIQYDALIYYSENGKLPSNISSYQKKQLKARIEEYERVGFISVKPAAPVKPKERPRVINKHLGQMNTEDAIKHTMKQTGVDRDTAARMNETVNWYTIDGYVPLRNLGLNKEITHGYTKEQLIDKREEIDKFIELSLKWNGKKLYRGMSFNTSDASGFLSKCEPGKKMDMSGVSSWSSSQTVSEEFIEYSYDDIKAMFVSKGTKQGTSIPYLSEFDDQEEVLISSKASWNVISKRQINGVWWIEVEEV